MCAQQTIEKSSVRPSIPTGTVVAGIFSPLRRNRMLWAGLAVALLLAVGIIWMLSSKSNATMVAGKSQYYDVVPTDLDITLAKRGDLDAVTNIDIVSKVEGQPIIQQLVPEGEWVKKDQVLCVLDSAELRVKIEDSSIEVQRAEADLTTAKEARVIQDNINTANLESAKVALQLAQLDLAQYTEGTYPQSLDDAQRLVEMSKITVANKQKDLEQTMNLFSKGFVTAADVEQGKLDVLTAQNELDKNTTALTVLQKYSHQRNLADYRNKLAQAEASLARTERENASSIAQIDADLQAKSQNFAVRSRRLDRLREQLSACTLTAPSDGIVIYSTSVAGNNRNNQNPIAEGTAVRERQPILRMPDTSAMKAVIRINEANIPRIKVGLQATVSIPGVDEPVKASLTKIAVLADSSQRWLNPDLKEYPVELTLDKTPPDLKPGLSVEVVISLDHLKQVLVVPIPCIYSANDKSYVFVRNGSGVRMQIVDVGRSNDSFVEIRSGIKSGEQVLMLGIGQGQQLADNFKGS